MASSANSSIPGLETFSSISNKGQGQSKQHPAKSSGGSKKKTSDGWEIVGGHNIKGGSTSASGGTGGGGKVQLGKTGPVKQNPFVKAEDIIPYEQVASFYTLQPFDDDEDEDAKQSKVSGTNHGKKGPTSAAAPSPKPVKNQGSNNKAVQQPKEKAVQNFKTLKDAAASISINDLKESIAKVKEMFPGNRSQWLLDVAAYLNSALPSMDSIAQFKELDNPLALQPCNDLSKKVKSVLTNLLSEVGDSEKAAAFRVMCRLLTSEMSKGSGVNGFLIMLDLLSTDNPKLVLSESALCEDLLKSWQNRRELGSALLWAFGNGGRKSFSAGLEIWFSYLRQQVRLKAYALLAVRYLSELFKVHSAEVSSCKAQWTKNRLLHQEHFFDFLETTFINGSSLNKDLRAQLTSLYGDIKAMSVGDCSRDEDFFPRLLSLLRGEVINSGKWMKGQIKKDPAKHLPVEAESEIVSLLVECVRNNPVSVLHYWPRMYRSHLVSSAKLLRALDANFKKLWEGKRFASDRDRFCELFSSFALFLSERFPDDEVEAVTRSAIASNGAAWSPLLCRSINLSHTVTRLTQPSPQEGHQPQNIHK